MSAYERRPGDDGGSSPGLQHQAERIGRRMTESAQQVWLAGLGALARAQNEGSRLFDSLVKEGEAAEERSREESTRGESLRDTVENTLGQARERAAGTWDRVEKNFEDRVHRVLRRMDIPSRSDIEALNERLDALNRRLTKAESRAAHAASPPHED
ncbi:poly(hydroxyalkanoate) granule-associated protein [Stenotrophomonas sp. ATCM1_4]|jgi:poly(hydroxyalkanoate) granule-associated protein|uniref:phasin family protein n=1 Tax=unclassified Stenotrophomonas TaxID=196198 RepID=UPI0010511267|nr:MULTISPECIES: phasin family protein [unclassified Stenotrophomonas]TDB27737.1 poly(hydroxyalkanoate) granule-associated protein [Stenotrophomonas sp. ATCM1_4]